MRVIGFVETSRRHPDRLQTSAFDPMQTFSDGPTSTQRGRSLTVGVRAKAELPSGSRLSFPAFRRPISLPTESAGQTLLSHDLNIELSVVQKAGLREERQVDWVR